MMKRLAKPEADMSGMQQDAAKVAEMGKLLEMAAKFREIYQTQESLVRRISTIREEMRKGMDQNRRLLPSLADTQEKNRKALDEFAAELQKRAEAMPDEEMFQPMKESALKFVEALEQADPGSAMDASASAGKASNMSEMLQNAELARAILERLMQKQEPFPQACQGQCQAFNVPHPDMNQTMAQLLKGMCKNAGMGDKPGEGMGMGAGGSSPMGGFGPTGSPMAGYGMMDLPVVGPDRMRFDAASMGGGKGGGKDGQTPGQKGLPVKTENASLKPGDLRKGDTPPPSGESVPEAYREAVKRYFTPAESIKTNPTSKP
jgi:beta-phosphoglucomutase-like phosphatase (HAD superfamily)